MILDIKTFVICSGFFLGIWGFSMLLYSILLKFSRNLGIRDKGDIIRWATTSKPALGGIAFYIVFLISFIFESIIFESPDLFANIGALGLLGAGSLAFLMGLADDAYNTRPILKFLVQVVCAGLLIGTGTSIDLFENELWNQVLTVLWVIGIMNSINMLDNMDGISTLTSLFIFMIAALYIALHNNLKSPDFIILLGLIATLFAFLFFNWSPSRMYMGDTGSQFLGIILAYIGIKYFWNSTLIDGTSSLSQQIWIFLIGFLLPITDTTIVTLNRILRGRSPFIGGRDHTTHNLVYFGLSDSQVALSFTAISIINLFLCFFLYRFIEEWTTLLNVFCGLYCFAIFASLLYLCIKQRDLYADSPE
jgi:UDP-GlcNAc:undecaprenyl-phosphate/decaprenyl-phosphate GlcNAc-1-phosphate transferase